MIFDLQKCIQENNLPKNISKINAIHQLKAEHILPTN
jgi:hypothetical protein